MKSWIRQHQFALIEAFDRLRRHPGNFLFNVLVVAIALALPFSGWTVLENIRPVSEQIAVSPEISVFMETETSRSQASSLAPQIQQLIRDGGSSGTLVFVPREQALEALKQKSAAGTAVAVLGSNPLPDAYIVKLANFESAAEATRLETLASQLRTLPGVEHVQVDSIWVKRLTALLGLLRLGLIFLAVTLSVVVVAVIFNTIRLQVMTQLEEIEVSRLVGATDAYIYRPFYYSGALLGLLAASLTLSVVAAGLIPLNGAIANLAQLYGAQFKLTPLGWLPALSLLAASALLGMGGAALSVRRYLSISTS